MTGITEAKKDGNSRRWIAERAAHAEGRRAINRVWEHTQRLIALAVTGVSLGVAAWLAAMGPAENAQASMVFIYGVANLVIGFYFGRTNHQRVGGVEPSRSA